MKKKELLIHDLLDLLGDTILDVFDESYITGLKKGVVKGIRGKIPNSDIKFKIEFCRG